MKYQPDHTAISARNLDSSVAFYSHFGFEECNRYEDLKNQYVIVMMELGNYQIEIFAFTENESVPLLDIEYEDKLKGIGVKHVAFGVESVEDALEELRAKGIADDSAKIKDGRLGRRYFFVKDPDGVWVEVIERKGSNAMEVAKKYFDLSNARDLDGIAGILADSATYSSENTGMHFGKEYILSMTKSFFESFTELHWEVYEVTEEKPGVILFDFTLTGTKNDGEKILRDGLEYVVVHEGKVQHVEVKNK